MVKFAKCSIREGEEVIGDISGRGEEGERIGSDAGTRATPSDVQTSKHSNAPTKSRSLAIIYPSNKKKRF